MEQRFFRLRVLTAIIALLCVAGGAVSSTSARVLSAPHPTIATIWQRIGARCGETASAKLPPYPWPLAPVHRQHPVRGYFGDPRTVMSGDGTGAFSFHNGVDISAFTGNHVLPVVSGVVVEVQPDRVVVASSDDRRFQYIHIVPRVSVGERVVASSTVLGVVAPVFHHVHFSEIRGICVVNPLMPGHLTPYRDTTHPVVRAILFENAAGKRVSPLRLPGLVNVVADAFAKPALPSRPPWGAMPVSPVMIRWKLSTMSGRRVAGATAVDFRVSLPPRRDFCDVYAPGTRQNFAVVLGRFHWHEPGRYLYELTPDLLDIERLRRGRYRFTVTAATTAGNTGSRSAVVFFSPHASAQQTVSAPSAHCPWAAYFRDAG